MADYIVYFGLPEFAVLLLAFAGGSAALAVLRQRQAVAVSQRRLLDALPYAACLFRRGTLSAHNAAGDEWRDNLDVRALAAESLKSGQNIVRTIPAVEGQSFQARAIRLSKIDTLVWLEDVAAAQRQQAFYRSFIQNVSHELKTPLTVIQGHAAKLGDAPDDREGWQASRRIITDEAKRLTQLVDNLLTLARLESPAFALERSNVNVAALLEDAVLQASDLADERRLALSLNLAPGLPRLNADRARLKQVVLNLLDNALKYTPPGGTVTAGARVEQGRVVITVADSGEGIPADDLPYIFDKLYRARRLKGRPVEGSGLGLTIARQIVWEHGGEINVQSELGRGTTFTVALPPG